MDRGKLKRELERLISEAPHIAPSIARFDDQHNYGTVTDESLDTQNSVRWELEAAAVVQELAASGVTVFKDLHAEYLKEKEESKRFHSRSILVHKIRELLVTAVQLLDSALSTPVQNLTQRSMVGLNATENVALAGKAQTSSDPWYRRPIGLIGIGLFVAIVGALFVARLNQWL